MYSGAGGVIVRMDGEKLKPEEGGKVVDAGVNGPRGLELHTVMLSLSISSSR